MKRTAKRIFTLVLIALAAAFLALAVPYCRRAAALDSCPDSLLPSMAYMLVNNRATWIRGAWGTLRVSVLGTLIGFAFAVLLSFVRTVEARKKDSLPVRAAKRLAVGAEKLYVAVVRGTPMMVQSCIIYYAGFELTRALMAGQPISEINRAWSFFAAALITVSMNTAAYLAEALRGGIESLDRSPVEAAQMDGASHWLTMTRIIFPQALQNALPAIGNELVNNIKGTSVLNIIGFVELMFATGTVAGFYYRYLSAYLIAAVIYLAMTVTITRAADWAMKKAGISGKN